VLKERRLHNILFVRNAICRLECVNKLVMYLVSLPVYVNVVHFRSCSIVGGWGGERRLGACWVWEGGLGRNCCGGCDGRCQLLVGIRLLRGCRSLACCIGT